MIWAKCGSQGIINTENRRSLALMTNYLFSTLFPSANTREDVEQLLRQVSLPKRNVSPQESCVTWIGSAVRELRNAGWGADFKVGRFWTGH